MKICLLLMLIGVIVGGSHFAGRAQDENAGRNGAGAAAVSVGI